MEAGPRHNLNEPPEHECQSAVRTYAKPSHNFVFAIRKMSFRQHCVTPIRASNVPDLDGFSPVRSTGRSTYSLVEKLRLVEKAKQFGFTRTVARSEGIPHQNLSRWIDQHEELKKRVHDLLKQKKKNVFRLNAGGRKGFDHEVTAQIIHYYRERRSVGLVVTRRLLVAYWRLLDPETVNSISEAAADQRMSRFMKRHNLVKRKKTHTAQKKKGVKEEIDDFLEYIEWKREMLGITNLDAVVNFDETNVYFSPQFNHTIETRGARTVTVVEPNSSSRCTAMLGVSKSGKKFPPYIIFAGKATAGGRVIKECRNPAQHGYSTSLTYMVQENAWMDEKCLIDWVDRVWKPYADSIQGPKLMLLDSYTAHMTAAVKRAIHMTGTELEFIPPGYTSKLQPMDVGLNKPFKDRLRHEVERFLTTNPLGEKPTRPIVSHWIDQAWEGITEEMIKNTWRHIGYGNNCAPHPLPEVVEDNNDFDPLALNEGDLDYSQDDDDYNSVQPSLGY